MSPDEFRTDLTDAWIAGTRDITEVGIADVPGRIVELRVVEDVEKFTPDLKTHCFIEGDHLRYS